MPWPQAPRAPAADWRAVDGQSTFQEIFHVSFLCITSQCLITENCLRQFRPMATVGNLKQPTLSLIQFGPGTNIKASARAQLLWQKTDLEISARSQRDSFQHSDQRHYYDERRSQSQTPFSSISTVWYQWRDSGAPKLGRKPQVWHHTGHASQTLQFIDYHTQAQRPKNGRC